MRILITPLLLGATLALLLVLSACSEEAAPTLTAVKTFSSGPRVMPTPQWTEPPPPVSEPDPRRNPPTSTDIPGIADPGSDEVGLYLVPRAPLGKVQVVYDFETIPFEFTGAATPSVDSRIYDADAVVRATFVSASDGILNFRANEYLKGSGPTVFTVAADTDGRNNQWDTHEAILFLATSGEQVSSGAQRQSGGQFIFIQSWEGNSYSGNLPEGFALGARTPLWLPSESTPQNSGGRSTANANPSFIIDLASPLGDANPTVSLNELRAAIAWQQGGTGVKGYDSCVRASLGNQRFHRDFEAYYAESWPPPSYESSIEAGQGQGAIVDSFERTGTKRYHHAWLSGDDAALFRYRIVDDDALPQNGFWTNIETERPLPAGTYLLTEHSQLGIYRPCNYIPTRHAFGWTVTVTPPPNTLHEAFFDPVTLGTGVGADSSNGVLNPASFTVDGTSTSITGLKWDSGSVTLSPYSSLSGHKLDFIELDGSVGLSLEVSSATEDTTAGTLTWPAATQPWHNGDMLMLRIGPSTTPAPTPTPEPTSTPVPTPTPSPVPSSNVTVTLAPRTESYGTVTTVTVNWTDPGNCDFQYHVALYDSQGNVNRGFGAHPAPDTTGITVETSLPWDAMPNSDLVARVSCEPLFETVLRLVGEADLRSGLP